MPSEWKSETWIIIELGMALLLLAGMSFFFAPHYEKGVWFIVQALGSALSMVMGYKFGRSMPQQAGDPKSGQETQSETTTRVSATSTLESPAVKVLILAFLLGAACSGLRAADHPMLPDAKLTPGAVDSRVNQATVQATICKPGYTATVRAVSDAEKRAVMVRYGLPISDLHMVEIDHFVSLEIGGSNAIENLWPQYYGPAPGQKGYLGARAKDVVETGLKRRVCSGAMTLFDAQQAIRAWPGMYRAIQVQKK